MKTAQTITFRPADLGGPLSVACVRLGVSASAIIRDCLRQSLAEVVARRARYSPQKSDLEQAVEAALKEAGNN